jgi:hypothetical protein
MSSCLSTDSSFVVSGQLPMDIEVKFRKIFRQCDVSRSGGFNECELIMSCSRNRDVANFFGLPQNMRAEDGSLEMATRMFHAIDSDQDHEITWEEFRAFFAARFVQVLAYQQQQLQGMQGMQYQAPQFEEPFPCEQPPPAPAQEAPKETDAPARIQAPPSESDSLQKDPSLSSSREGAFCRYCGKQWGMALCGVRRTLHESQHCPKNPGSRLSRRSSGIKARFSSTMTVPEDSGVHSTQVIAAAPDGEAMASPRSAASPR